MAAKKKNPPPQSAAPVSTEPITGAEAQAAAAMALGQPGTAQAAPTVNEEFLAELNASRTNRGLKPYKTINDFLTDNGRLDKTDAGYKNRQARVENFRGQAKREEIVLSGDLIDEARKLYGSTADLYNIPELKSLFEEAFINKWTPAELMDRIDASDWAKARTDSQEKFDLKKTVKPEDAAADIAANLVVVKRILAGKGLTITDAQAQEIAEKGTRNGWSSTEWDTYTASDALTYIGAGRAATGGATAVTAPGATTPTQVVAPTTTTLRTIARQFGVGLSDATANDYVAKIAQGIKTEDQFREEMRASAKSLFPTIADRLDTSDFETVTSPYKRLMSQILEVPEDNVDLTKSEYSDLFSAGDPKSPRLMNQTEWTKFLRKRPEWQNTNNAYREYSEAANVLNRIFGGYR